MLTTLNPNIATDMNETLRLDHNFRIEVEFYKDHPDSEIFNADCEIYFNNFHIQEFVRINVDNAKDIIATLTRFVEAKENSNTI